MSYESFKQQYAIELNEQQEKAVKTVDGAVLLLAVPGSGKTTVLINRLGYMIYELQIPPEQILTVTYTVAATRDMMNRFLQKFGTLYERKLEFRTINSLSQRILYYYGKLTGKEVYPVIENSARAGLIKTIFLEVNQTYATENDVKNIETAITYVKNMRLNPKELEKYQVEVKRFPVIYRRYNEELRKNGMIDFDDQMVYALLLLEKIPGMLEHFQNQYRYICVDEAQDTSKLQHDMIALLAKKSGNLFMVGDEDQSIYGFRAAYPDALVQFEERHSHAQILLMETNYRSGGEIVYAADKLIACNRNRHAKNMQAARGEAGKISLIPLKTRKAQISYLLKVAKECEREIAILYRNHESALPLIDMLEREKIGYRVKNSEITFFSHPVVADITDFVRMALDPTDAEAFRRIYYKMGAGISKASAQYAIEYGNGMRPLLQYVEGLEDISAYTRKQCRALSTHFQNMRQEGAGKAVYRILHFMGYEEYMKEHGMDIGKAQILQLLADAVERLEDFLPRLSYLQEQMAGGESDENSRIILSTIHSSKGLEYDTVYLVDMLNGTLPSIPEPLGKQADPAELALYEEERRLYYVGMTRARNELRIFTFDDVQTSAFSRRVAKELSNRKVQVQVHEFAEGMAVSHKKFGDGIIRVLDGDIAEIHFDKVGATKRLALDYALETGVLRRR